MSSADWCSVARTWLLRKSDSVLGTRPFTPNLTISPSNLATFQSYFQPFISNPAALKTLPSPSTILASIRNASPKQLAFAGVTAAEVIGFFTVGEMIGRMNIIGYRGEPAHAH